MPKEFRAWSGDRPRLMKDMRFRCCLNQGGRRKGTGSTCGKCTKCARCTYVIPARGGRPARRCKVPTCDVFDRCHHHRFGIRPPKRDGRWPFAKDAIKLRLRVNPAYPGHGRGVFVEGPPPGTLVYQAGDRVCQMGGQLLTKRQLDRRYDDETDVDDDGNMIEYNAPYGIRDARTGRVLDSACRRDVGDFVNDARGRAGARPNVALPHDISGRHPLLTALGDIYSGDELLVTYGDDYWAGPQLQHELKTVRTYKPKAGARAKAGRRRRGGSTAGRRRR